MTDTRSVEKQIDDILSSFAGFAGVWQETDGIGRTIILHGLRAALDCLVCGHTHESTYRVVRSGAAWGVYRGRVPFCHGMTRADAAELVGKLNKGETL